MNKSTLTTLELSSINKCLNKITRKLSVKVKKAQTKKIAEEIIQSLP